VPVVLTDKFDMKKMFLVQTAGHIAGQAYYLQPSDIKIPGLSVSLESLFPAGKVLYGASIHDVYGGWFAFRGALVYPGLACKDAKASSPSLPSLLQSEAAKIALVYVNIMGYNGFKPTALMDVWRNINLPAETYGEEQTKYFDATEGEARRAIRHTWLNNNSASTEGHSIPSSISQPNDDDEKHSKKLQRQ